MPSKEISKTFDPKADIPDLSGKVILVTGGNSGLGEATITAYAQHSPSKIWLAARSRVKAVEAVSRIKSTGPNVNIEVLDLDLASLAFVKKAAARFNAESTRLDILQLNGGVAVVPYTQTKEGYEIHFGTNYVGHAMLTCLLMPKLLSTAAQPNSDVRIIVMSSIAHKQFALNEGIIFSGVTSDMRNHKGVQLYGQANLAKTLFARSLAKRYPQLTISSLHPGTVWTAVWTGEKSISSLLATVVMYAARLTGVSPAEGSKNQLWCSVSKNVKNGAYYEPIGKESPGKLSYDDVLGERLWEWTSKELQKHGAPGWPSSPRAD